MFETTMLLAFLLAATSQLIPRKRDSNRLTSRETDHRKKKKQHKPLQKSAKRLDKCRGNAKRRDRDHVYAA